MFITRFLLCSLVALLFSNCAATTKQGRTAATTGRKMVVRTTAYTANEPGGSRGAGGERLHFGGESYSAAADWSWLPLGTRFKMVETGRTYVIEDYGSALVGKKTIDLFMPSSSAMHSWGVRNVNIEVLEWGSKAMSLRLLEPRSRNAHVGRMVAALRQDKTAQPEAIAAWAKPKPATKVAPLLAKRD